MSVLRDGVHHCNLRPVFQACKILLLLPGFEPLGSTYAPDYTIPQHAKHDTMHSLWRTYQHVTPELEVRAEFLSHRAEVGDMDGEFVENRNEQVTQYDPFACPLVSNKVYYSSLTGGTGIPAAHQPLVSPRRSPSCWDILSLQALCVLHLPTCSS